MSRRPGKRFKERRTSRKGHALRLKQRRVSSRATMRTGGRRQVVKTEATRRQRPCRLRTPHGRKLLSPPKFRTFASDGAPAPSMRDLSSDLLDNFTSSNVYRPLWSHDGPISPKERRTRVEICHFLRLRAIIYVQTTSALLKN